MNNKDPCFGCHTNNACEMRKLLLSTHFKEILGHCPCVKCIVKPSCTNGCDQRHHFSNLFSSNEFETRYLGKVKGR